MKNLVGMTALWLGSAAMWLAPGQAQAGIEVCGDIDIDADAHCELRVDGGCVAQCEPPTLRAACAARLEAQCEGECNAEFSAMCTAGCEADCDAQCEVDPGMIDCRGACEADCDAACDAECQSDDSECRASCEASCSATCEGRCEVVPPEAQCDARCEAACEGSCEAIANIDCQIDCQADGYVDCYAELEGGCEVACQRPEGALFCDGQYIDVGNQLEACIAELKERFDIEVEGAASADCEGNTCTAEAEGSVGCSTIPQDRELPMMLFGVFVMIGTLGTTALRRVDAR